MRHVFRNFLKPTFTTEASAKAKGFSSCLKKVNNYSALLFLLFFKGFYLWINVDNYVDLS